ncbi:serine/threonine protein kinase [Streptomyces sp. XM4193]|uniref:serine/threonine-protein kinase n=1 Tax=Streptomyces sp. XM4193 TaxID=2929782 RepID=UPI001FF858CC|nr:serine/threonine-protein kinase [Streptomyces sp. XM4193]MCK1796378.1 serine/threonine protein kinase [Streptomyces sp. XM4193]
MSGGSAGRRVDGRFELLEPLGSGGMGTVWRARDHALEREVALKEVRAPSPSALGDEDTASRKLRERVLREARALARINHPGVVTIHHIVDQQPHPWLVMELVPGDNLHERLAHGPLAPAVAARIGREVLGALRAAHAAGIHHRDVKPANVLLRADGSAVLTDFGIAAVQGSTSVTATGELVGSPEYIAPERIRSAADHPAADLWSLGMLLYIATEGHSPLRRETALATLAAVLDEPVPPPVRSGPLTPVLNALLVRDPSARPDAARLDAMLEYALRDAPAEAPAPRTPGGVPVPPAPPSRPGPAAPPNAPTVGSFPAHPPATPATPPGTPTPPNTQPPVPGPATVATAPPGSAPPGSKGRNRRALVAGTAVGALLLGGGIIAAVQLTGGDRDGRAATGETGSTTPGDADKSPDSGADRADDPSDGPADRKPEEGGEEPEEEPTEAPATGTEEAPPTPTPDRPDKPSGWVAQLFSEPVSTGIATRDRRLAAVRKSVPQAQVLRSDDHASLNPGYWVIYAPGPFSDGKAAVAFCASKGRTGSGDCVGRYLSDAAADRVYVCHPQGGGSGRCTRS